jgi:hypothetical protein
MAADVLRRLRLQKLALRDVNGFASSTVLKQGFNGDGAVVSYLKKQRR